MPHDDPYVPGLKPWRATLREIEAKFPGLTMPATAWHANEIIKRLDRLIELAERQAVREASR